MMERWRNRVALVTGASSGIGQEVARLLLREGMRVVATGRRQERLEALVQEASDTDSLWPAVVDLRHEEALMDLFGRIRERWGGVDVLVNSAGLGRDASLMDGATSAWREMLEVNVLALCVCTREAVADMRRRGDDGHVIHISSMSGHRVPPQGGVYSATKHAVKALTEGLRQELRAADSGIRVTSLSPGWVKTEFAHVYFGSEEEAERAFPRFKVLEAVDVAEAVRYVLGCPAHVQIHDVLMRSTAQPS